MRGRCRLWSQQLNAFLQSSRTTLATILRTSGATTNTVGKATIQAGIQDDIQSQKTPSIIPAARTVAIPETISDMSPDNKKPNRTGP